MRPVACALGLSTLTACLPGIPPDEGFEPAGRPDFRCERTRATFVEAARELRLGDHDLDVGIVNFMASTRDGSLVPTSSLDERVDGTMAIQSRPCGPDSARPGSCNVTGFDGELLGHRTTPERAMRFDEGWWCADDTLYFAGFARVGHTSAALLVHLRATEAPEPDWDPVLDPDARVFVFEGNVWQVPPACTLADAPCGGTLVATGTFVRTDELVWWRW